jgi:UDP-2,3-diacylglucosamine hydrolase
MKDSRALYFASDLHLGTPDYYSSLQREKVFIRWLDTVAPDAQEIYILGDLFDFWFEYKKVIPKGYVRLLGKLADLSDQGASIKIFAGNHDLWYKDYFPKYLGIEVFHAPQTIFFQQKKIFIAHGDGLGPGDWGYKLLKKLLKSKINQYFFEWLHPNIGIYLANKFSHTSRKMNGSDDVSFKKDKEYIYQFATQMLSHDSSYNYFIFGHRHIPLECALSPEASLIILGDWLKYNSYLKMNNNGAFLEYFKV